MWAFEKERDQELNNLIFHKHLERYIHRYSNSLETHLNNCFEKLFSFVAVN